METPSLYRIPLEGGKEEFTFIGNTAKLRGIAVDATYVYWAAQGEEAIGRIPIADFPEIGPCEDVPSCDNDFVEVEGELNGLAADAQHLYWSINGEAPANPGNDLYRFEAAQNTGGRDPDRPDGRAGRRRRRSAGRAGRLRGRLARLLRRQRRCSTTKEKRRRATAKAATDRSARSAPATSTSGKRARARPSWRGCGPEGTSP